LIEFLSKPYTDTMTDNSNTDNSNTEEDSRAIEAALGLAISFHRGQRDSDGAPYILHLIRVMLRCKSAQAKQAGVLHDILEDTSASCDDLLAAGISARVIEAVKHLTHAPGIPYADYIEALVCDPIATEVKLADLEDNYSIGRVKYRQEHREHDADRLQRYILSHRFLEGQIQLDEYRKFVR